MLAEYHPSPRSISEPNVLFKEGKPHVFTVCSQECMNLFEKAKGDMESSVPLLF
jgi:hypothetical protein